MQRQSLCRLCDKYYLTHLGCQKCTNDCHTICYLSIPGPQGASGFIGATGLNGNVGSTGAGGGDPGATGIQGFIGATGIQGLDGSTGNIGIQGFIGSTGLQGIQGSTGINGHDGATGTQGSQGSTGLQGFIGSTGIGSTGIQGNIGSTGIQGATGFIGSTGIGSTGIGSTGIQGDIGSTGIQGATGIGFQGATGIGSPGATGVVAQSFGNFYQNNIFMASNTILAVATTPPQVNQFINFTSGIIENMNYDSVNNAVIIENSGTYLANYMVNVETPSASNAIGLYNLSGGIYSLIQGSVFLSNSDQIVGTVGFTAQANDEISIANVNNATALTIYNTPLTIGHTMVTNVGTTTTVSSSITINSTPVKNSIYVSIQWFGTITISSITDTLIGSGSYTPVSSTVSFDSSNVATYYRDNSVAGSLIVTVTFSSAVSNAMEVLVLGNTTTPSFISSAFNYGTTNLSSFTESVTLNPVLGQLIYLTGFYNAQSSTPNISQLFNNVDIVDQSAIIHIPSSIAFDAFKFVTVAGSQQVSMMFNNSGGFASFLLLGIVIGYVSTPLIVPANSASLTLTQVM